MNALEHMHELLAALELALLEAGWWGDASPDDAALASIEPFCVDTLRFSEWLQWVYIPKMRAYMAAHGELPERSGLLARQRGRHQRPAFGHARAGRSCQ